MKRFGVPTFAILVTVVVLACGSLTEAEQRYTEGVDAHDAERLEEAVTLYTEAIELDPELVEAYSNRSAAYGGLGRWDEALDDATRAVELEPTDVTVLAGAHLNRGASYGALGRWDEALDDATKAIELEPNDESLLANAYFVRAIAGAELGRDEEAEADFATACELGRLDVC